MGSALNASILKIQNKDKTTETRRHGGGKNEEYK
jgi:hypothetical protein